MSNNLSKSIKELTISYLSDGQMRSTKEIKTFLTKNNVNFEKSHSTFSTAMTNLKKENPLLKNPKRGFYYLEISKKDDIETHTTSADNIFEDFEGKSNNIDFLREGINKGETSLGKVKLNGETYYANFNPLDSIKWNAVFLIPKDEVYQDSINL